MIIVSECETIKHDKIDEIEHMAAEDQPDSPISRALKERKELQEVIKAAAQKLEKIEQFLRMYRQYNVGSAATDMGVIVDAQVIPGVPSSQEGFEQLVRALLMEVGRPMESGEIIEKFRERGHPLGRSNEVKQTWNKLWRAKTNGKLTHEPKLGYWLPGEPVTAEAQAAALRAKAERKLQRGPRVARGGQRPWTGNPPGRRRSLSDSQLNQAEQWILEGKMTRKQIAEALGVSAPAINYYFHGGLKTLQEAAASRLPEALSPAQAKYEHARLVAETADHNRHYYQEDKPIITDTQYDSLRSRIKAIEARFPKLQSSYEKPG